MLKVEGLGVSCGGTPAIESLDFEIKCGEFVAILGPSGCGRSSMLNVISGLLPQTQGLVEVHNLPLYNPGRAAPKLGYMFQPHRLLPLRTVKQNLELVLAAADVPKDE
ncbi:ATP-binding cassette domain-containing protein [Pelagibacterium halotolerans]|uniref:ABC-transporter, ATP-binding component n=1 Tax=Pelagibacterium halotolerans (strain DSM 22347 / JCM 15775 / CGMCC 1.7692 / B2) TaxID=1082931 RepID=G4RBG4_PELHB|nr:ATP-binding cassette domain-containing protein [Pelagibacterium halotolerans]AEQ52640.1 ABC-transporter, ATP-binding component [Pelagibacterium halotolerans B2]QJR17655.1 ATP-binding cassette domain-containing protein [Pelagibacterium halotolerans]SEA83642.1 NitT/TauT family transport system ATP-binding protein [Pelagibacterium halotolerans]